LFNHQRSQNVGENVIGFLAFKRCKLPEIGTGREDPNDVGDIFVNGTVSCLHLTRLFVLAHGPSVSVLKSICKFFEVHPEWNHTYSSMATNRYSFTFRL